MVEGDRVEMRPGDVLLTPTMCHPPHALGALDTMTDDTVIHRLRLSQADAHYGGDLIAAGRIMELFGDAATELCIRTDGDEKFECVEQPRPHWPQ